MAQVGYRIPAVTRGKLTEYMRWRQDTEFYIKGLKAAENIDILPHGPFRRRNGLVKLAALTDARSVLEPHRVTEQLQFTLVMRQNQIDIYRNGIFQTRLTNGKKRISRITINTPGSGYSVNDALTFTGGGGSGAIAKVSRIGPGGSVTGITITHPGYDYDSAPTVGESSSGTGATFTATLSRAYDVPWLWDDLSELKTATVNETKYFFHTRYRNRRLQRQSSDVIWNIDVPVENPEPSTRYADTKGIKFKTQSKTIQLKSSTASVGSGATLTADTALFRDDWIGRTVQLREGTGNITDVTNSTTAVWNITAAIGTGATTFTKLWSAISTNHTLTSDTDIFTSSWVGRWVYLRRGYGQVTAFTDAKNVTWQIFKDIGVGFQNYRESWEERIESSDRGFATCGIVFQDRLYKAGFLSKPNTVAASQTGDFLNFDDTDPTKDDYGFVFTINSDRSDRIQNMIAKNSLQLLTDGTEWLMVGNPGITPTDVSFELQTSVGSSPVTPVSVDNETYFISRTGDQLMAFTYSLEKNSYVTRNYTIVAGSVLDEPAQMAFLRSWLDSQANYVYVVNGRGNLAVLGVSVEQEVLGWFEYETQGEVKSICVTTVNLENGRTADRLFAIVERENGVFLEALSPTQLENNQYIYMDCWVEAEDVTPGTEWSGFTEFAGQTVSVVNRDGVDLGDFVVQEDGDLVIDTNETHIYVGLPYTSDVETMNIDIDLQGVMTRGQPQRLMYVDVDFFNRMWIQIEEGTRGRVRGYTDTVDLNFRLFDDSLFDAPATPFTGMQRVWITTYADVGGPEGPQLSVRFKSSRPLPFQVNGLIAWLDV